MEDFNKQAILLYQEALRRLTNRHKSEFASQLQEWEPCIGSAIRSAPYLSKHLPNAEALSAFMGKIEAAADSFLTDHAQQFREAQKSFTPGTAVAISRYVAYTLLATLFFSPDMAFFIGCGIDDGRMYNKITALLLYLLLAPHDGENGSEQIIFFFTQCERLPARTEVAPLKLHNLGPEASMFDAHNNGIALFDFANRFVGGGALNGGCVQEELMFVENPELYIGSLLLGRPQGTDVSLCSPPSGRCMGPGMSVSAVGVLRFVEVLGYASRFKIMGDDPERVVSTAMEIPLCRMSVAGQKLHVRRTFVGIADSDNLSRRPTSDSFTGDAVHRHVCKVFAAFRPMCYAGDYNLIQLGEQSAAEGDLPDFPYMPVAIGNWGCGVYRCHPVARILQQIIGAWALNAVDVYNYPRDTQPADMLAAFECFVDALNSATSEGDVDDLASHLTDWEKIWQSTKDPMEFIRKFSKTISGESGLQDGSGPVRGRKPIFGGFKRGKRGHKEQE